ncbi:MAG: hypothetical protein LC797_16460 [Chloroflexi bacterium]|nr:hypothetical protein [Chloroflexota bacterium]
MHMGVGSAATVDGAAGSVPAANEWPIEGQRFLRGALAGQIVLGLLWGISMLFFASAIALDDHSGPHIEKIALEGGAHFALVFGAILVWRAPRQARDLLLVMIFLNALWALTDLVYIPLFKLTAVDFYAKLIVNAGLAIALAVAARRSGILTTRHA